jgi:hypothetical protein
MISRNAGPGLVPGLCAHEGIGFVAGLDTVGVPWVLGEKGRVRLDTGVVIGQDPLKPCGDHSAEMLRRALLMPEAPDLYINSRVTDITLDIAAFEPLVGADGPGRLAGPCGPADPLAARGGPARRAHRRCRSLPHCARRDATYGRPAQDGAGIGTSHAAWDRHAVHGVRTMYSGNIPRSVGCLRLRLRAQIPDILHLRCSSRCLFWPVPTHQRCKSREARSW